MSVVPRPTTRPSCSRRRKGSPDHGWPSTGTQSVCPESTTPPGTAGPMRASRFAFVPSGESHPFVRDVVAVQPRLDDRRAARGSSGGRWCPRPPAVRAGPARQRSRPSSSSGRPVPGPRARGPARPRTAPARATPPRAGRRRPGGRRAGRGVLPARPQPLDHRRRERQRELGPSVRPARARMARPAGVSGRSSMSVRQLEVDLHDAAVERLARGTELGEQPEHRLVVRQHVVAEHPDPVVARRTGQQGQQHRAEPPALVAVQDRDGGLRHRRGRGGGARSGRCPSRARRGRRGRARPTPRGRRGRSPSRTAAARRSGR
jgi:hypothetical protein